MEAAKELAILYEDNHLLIINKRPAELVQGDRTQDPALKEQVGEYLKTKYHKPGNVYVGVAHRLDRPVSGIVLFTKTSKALSRMNEQFRENRVQKIYWAVTQSPPPEQAATVTRYLLKNEQLNKSFVVQATKRGAKEASLSYKLLYRFERYYLLEIRPHTGRHHQIRVLLASLGCPIKGDLKYGAPRSNPDGSIHLHARSLGFEHPVKKTGLTITAEPPLADKLWRLAGERFPVKQVVTQTGEEESAGSDQPGTGPGTDDGGTEE